MHVSNFVTIYRSRPITMTTGLLLVIQIILYHMTAAAVYNYNETSENSGSRGFRNITNKDFILGGLFPVTDCSGLGSVQGDLEFGSVQGGLELLEAMLFAIDQINNDMNLLPNLIIGYDVRDTCNHVTFAISEASDFIFYLTQDYNNFLGIVGPAYITVTHSVATILGLGYFRIPVISYATSDAALSNEDLYEYFLRTIPSDNLQVNGMVDFVSYFGWEYVSMIFNDNDYGVSASNAFINVAAQHNICLDAKIDIPPSGAEFNQTVVKVAIRTLLNSTASVVIVFADEDTVLALFEELNKVNSTQKFVWIASDKWANSHLVHEKFPEVAKQTFGFQLHTKHVKEFADYFSQLTPSTNIRDPFFPEYYEIYCDGSDCPNGLANLPYYTQGDIVPHVIDAVYAFAHALQNFLDFSCDSPIRWNRTAQRCDGMKYPLSGKNLLGYL